MRVDERDGLLGLLAAQHGGIEAGGDEEVPRPLQCPGHLRLAHPAGRPRLRQMDSGRSVAPALGRRSSERLGRRGLLIRTARCGRPVRALRLRGERGGVRRAAAVGQAGNPPRGGEDRDQQHHGDRQAEHVPALAAPPGRGVRPPRLRAARLPLEPPRHHPGPCRRLLGRPRAPGFGLPEETLPLVVRYGRPAPAQPAAPVARFAPGPSPGPGVVRASSHGAVTAGARPVAGHRRAPPRAGRP